MKDLYLLKIILYVHTLGKGQGYQESDASGAVPRQAAALPEAGGGQTTKGREEEAGEGEDDERD